MFKKLSALLIGMILLTAVSCANKKTQQEEATILNESVTEDENLFSADILGFRFIVPQKWKNSQNIDSVFWEPSADTTEPFFGGTEFSFFSDETLEKLNKFMNSGKEPAENTYQEIINERNPLLSIYIFRKNLFEEDFIAAFTNLSNNEKLGEQDGLVYYLSYPNKKDIQGLSETSQEIYDELYHEIENLKKTIQLFPPTFGGNPIEKMSLNSFFPEFESKDIYGKKVTHNIFSEYALTMVNVWGTFCAYCIREMPQLEEIYQEMKEKNINVIGIIGDAKGNEQIAKDIITKTKVTYTNIIPDKNIENNFLKHIYAFPTTVFVNSDGKIIGEPVIGAQNKEQYRNQILKYLEE
ncbi:MAG TPA: redoxin domain-containing protein [Clostridiales bacterium]|nr:redoxin domain-containing protein [Clostridiales bacterium]